MTKEEAKLMPTDLCTLEQFRSMENFAPKEPFSSVIIVPMNETHDSGYMCMKYILAVGSRIVGVLGGSSDILHINGIGGYGMTDTFEEVMRTQKVDRVDWRIDCLLFSNCIRLFSDRLCVTDRFFGSDFSIYPLKKGQFEWK